MMPTELYSRNTQMAIDVFIRGRHLDETVRKYRITHSSLIAVLHHMAACTLGHNHDSLIRIRREVSDRLASECLDPDPLLQISKSGTG